MSRSYFGKAPTGLLEWDGKRDDMFDKGDWQAELAALHVVIKGDDNEGDTAAKVSEVEARAAI